MLESTVYLQDMWAPLSPESTENDSPLRRLRCFGNLPTEYLVSFMMILTNTDLLILCIPSVSYFSIEKTLL